MWRLLKLRVTLHCGGSAFQVLASWLPGVCDSAVGRQGRSACGKRKAEGVINLALLVLSFAFALVPGTQELPRPCHVEHGVGPLHSSVDRHGAVVTRRGAGA